MTMSPASRCGSRSAIAASTTAAGTISQIARGVVERGHERADRDAAPVAPSPASACTASRGTIEDDALVAAAHEAPHHVGAHAPETDHAELHSG